MVLAFGRTWGKWKIIIKNVFKFKIILNNNKKRESFCDKHNMSYQWTET